MSGQRSIASFFGAPKAKAPVAKECDEEGKKLKMAEEEGEAGAHGSEGTPAKQSVEESSSPPTRKRVRQAQSDDESDDEPPPRKEAEKATEKMEVDEEGHNEAEGGAGKGGTGEEKEEKEVQEPKEEKIKSPEKKKPAASMASFFGTEAQRHPVKKASEAKVKEDKAASKGDKEEDGGKAKAASKKPESGSGAQAGGGSSSGKTSVGGEGKKDDKEGKDGSDAEDDEEDGHHEEAAKAILSSGSQFDAQKEATWKKGEPVPYQHLAQAFEKIEATSKRLEISTILTRALRTVIETTPGDLLPCVYMSVNKLAPAHAGIELGLGEMVLKKALAEATGRQGKDITLDYQKVGDLGTVAMKSRSMQRTMFQAKALTVQHVHKVLLQIARMEGSKSGEQKKNAIKGLLVASKGVEAQYVIRHLQGKMRIGLAEQTVLVALAHAVAMSPPPVEGEEEGPRKTPRKEVLDKAVETLKEVFCQMPCYDMIVPCLLKHPIEELPKHCFLTPGVPIKPMLAHPTKGISEVLDRFANQNFTCEFKYDGERGQIHMTEDGKVRIFSRNSECNTSKYPDLINLMPDITNEGVKTFVLDCEVVAYDREAKRILPFQVLSTRKRKDADESDIKVQVCLFAFDMLYLNGKPLIKRPLRERREALRASFTEREGLFMFATARDASDTEEILTFLNESVAASCEGLMVKTLEEGGSGATYEPDKRSHKWLKVKKDYIKGMTDSLDLVPIGAFWGKGKRTGVYGAFLLACYNEETEDYETICKIGTGFSDEQLKQFHEELSPHVIPGPKSYFQWEQIPKDTPDVWLEPSVVWEVSAADLSISPVHKAAIGHVDAGKGIALRFPRLVRVRDDKGPENATNSTQVAMMYQNQAVVGDGGGMHGDDD